MRILLIGATGTIGKAVASALAPDNEIIAATRNDSAIAVDITDAESIRRMYEKVGAVDAVICAAGDAKFKPLNQLTDADFESSLHNKLMGQVNVIRYGLESVRDRGSITVTGGILARQPMPGAAAISMVNAGLEGFVHGAAVEAPRGIRVNLVSPPWVTETLRALGMDESRGVPAATVAQSYVAAVGGTQNGAVIEP